MSRSPRDFESRAKSLIRSENDTPDCLKALPPTHEVQRKLPGGSRSAALVNGRTVRDHFLPILETPTDRTENSMRPPPAAEDGMFSMLLSTPIFPRLPLVAPPREFSAL